MIVSYTPLFIKQYKKLPIDLQEEVKEKISLFKENHEHSFLKTHKLKGRLKDRFSFSVNYAYRIVFQYLSKNEAVLLCIGDHDVYKS